MSLANYWDWLVAVRCSFPPEIRPFPDFCFTSQEHPRYPSAWSPRSRPESRSSVVVYTTPTREASTFPRHLHYVTPISLPFSARSAYFPSPRAVTTRVYTSSSLPTTDFQTSRHTNSFVCIDLAPLCRLFVLFSAFVSFVFNRLQPLFRKHPGWGCPPPRCLCVSVANPPFLLGLCFHTLTNCFTRNPFVFTLICVWADCALCFARTTPSIPECRKSYE